MKETSPTSRSERVRFVESALNALKRSGKSDTAAYSILEALSGYVGKSTDFDITFLIGQNEYAALILAKFTVDQIVNHFPTAKSYANSDIQT